MAHLIASCELPSPPASFKIKAVFRNYFGISRLAFSCEKIRGFDVAAVDDKRFGDVFVLYFIPVCAEIFCPNGGGFVKPFDISSQTRTSGMDFGIRPFPKSSLNSCKKIGTR